MYARRTSQTYIESNMLGRWPSALEASLGTIVRAAQRRAFKFSIRPEFENLLQLFFGAYKSAAIVFRVVFDIIDICVLCV